MLEMCEYGEEEEKSYIFKITPRDPFLLLFIMKEEQQ